MCCSPWGCKESDTTEGLNLEDCLLIFLSVFLFFWKSSMGCLALELAAIGWSLLSV